jgi:hypothetical protein
MYVYNSSTGGNQRAGQFVQASQSTLYGYGIMGSTILGANKCVGVYGSAYSGSPLVSPKGYGVWGLAGNAASGYNFGVLAQILGSNNGAAIYAMVPGKTEGSVPGMYAAYLRGMVYIEDSLRVVGRITCQHLYQTSDEILKRNITPVGTGNIEKLKQLSAVKYQMISEESYLRSINTSVSDTSQISKENISLQPGDQTYIGLLAQDVQKVYPEMVKKDENGILAVSYTSLVPVLIEAIKEQQMEIDKLKELVAALQKKVGL